MLHFPTSLSPFSFYGPLSTPSPILLTCDHASNFIPPPYIASPSDLPWLQTHWAFDPGAADLTKALSQNLSLFSILSNFSRLIADPNRDPSTAPDWIALSIEGGAHAPTFNQNLSTEHKTFRLLSFHEPYHHAISATLNYFGASCHTLLGIHSFTPLYLNQTRPMHACVMFDHLHAASGTAFAKSLNDLGLPTALNDPYSGITGPFHSVTRHGQSKNMTYLQLEVRQDLLLEPSSFTKISKIVSQAILLTLIDRPPVT
jgi:predicted N-formylglutamate amidohydrolase